MKNRSFPSNRRLLCVGLIWLLLVVIRPPRHAPGADAQRGGALPPALATPAVQPPIPTVTDLSGTQRLALRLPARHQPAWQTFAAEFPELDPTDIDAFHLAVNRKREQFGYELTPATHAAWHEWISAMEAMSEALVTLRAEELGLERVGVTADGRGFWLSGFLRQEPQYVWTMNVEAAITTNAHRLRANSTFDPLAGGAVRGEGLYVNVNDGGTLFEHPEFQLPDDGGSRIVYKEVNDAGARDHATHVAGTVAAWGYNPLLEGMAPRAWIRSHIQQSISDITLHGMALPGQKSATSNPVTGEQEMQSVMGTTSLGSVDSTATRGLYTSTSRSFDQVLWDVPHYIHFYAAGNAGSNFSTISLNNPIAKNTLTIGSVGHNNRDSEGQFLDGGVIAPGSSRGPTYDGRIKPDFTANGISVRSPDSLSGDSLKNGTSMATPNASGSTVLLIDYLQRKFPGHFPRSSTLRALLMSSALDLGNPGPDYIYGWGVVDVLGAADIVKSYAADPSSRVLVEDELAPAQSWSFTYSATGEAPIVVSLAWIDPPGAAQSATGSPDRLPRLVNDLQLRLIGPDGTHLPWVLPFTTGQGEIPAYDDSLRNANAVPGNNFTDNVEQVYLASPVAGVYTVQISHAGALHLNQAQKFSLAMRGLTSSTPLAPLIASVSPTLEADVEAAPFTVTGSGFVLGTDILLRRSGQADVTAQGLRIVGNRIEGNLRTLNLSGGYWDLVLRAPDGSETVLPQAWLLPVELLPPLNLRSTAVTQDRIDLAWDNPDDSAEGLHLDRRELAPSPVTVLLDNSDATLTGSWTLHDSPAGFEGTDFASDAGAGKGALSLSYTPGVNGPHQLDLRTRVSPGGADRISVDVLHRNGNSRFWLSQSSLQDPRLNWDFRGVADGQSLGQTTNEGTQSASWSSSPAESTVLNGALRLNPASLAETWAGNGSLGFNSGVYALEVDLAGWNLVGATTDQWFQLTFNTANNTTVSCGLVLEQTATGFAFWGRALGTGATHIGGNANPVKLYPHQQLEAVTLRLVVDFTDNSYQVFYRDASTQGAFVAAAGSGALDPARKGGSLRLRVSGNWSSAGEYIDVSRIRVLQGVPDGVDEWRWVPLGLLDLDGDSEVRIANTQTHGVVVADALRVTPETVNGPWQRLADLAPAAQSHADESVAPARDYEYRIRAWFGERMGDWSSVLQVRSADTVTAGYTLWKDEISWQDLSDEPSADPDGDGLSNFAEYALGLNPLLSDKAATLQVDTVEAAGVTYLRYQFTRNRAAADVAFVLVHSSHLGSWQELRRFSPGVDISADPDVDVLEQTEERQTLRVRVPAPGETHFLGLHIESP